MNEVIPMYEMALEPLYPEYAEACRSFSNENWILAVVHLRRIMEVIILDTFEQLKKENVFRISKHEFMNFPLSERLDAVSDFLPYRIQDDQGLRDIMTKDILELTEDECRRMFPLFKKVMDRICEDRIALFRFDFR